MSPDKPQATAAASVIAPLARPLTQCPYCEHDSPPGSKFCNACGAALHLVPCPHCGAVNDITQTSCCARCQGELLPPPALELSAAEPPLLPSTRPLPPWPAAVSAAAPRIRWLLGGAALAVLAAGGLYALRAPPPPAPPAPPTVRAEPPAIPAAPVATAATAATAAVLLPVAAPASAAPPGPMPEPMPEPTPELQPNLQAPSAQAPAARAPAPRPPARPQPAAEPAPAPAAVYRPPSEGLNPPSGPPPGPCTEAVAALGLCQAPDRRP